jgi:hypothetical protein
VVLCPRIRIVDEKGLIVLRWAVGVDHQELPNRTLGNLINCVWEVVRPFWITASERKPSYFSSKTHSGWSKGRGLRDNGMGWNAIGRENSRPNGERWAK